MAQVHSNNGALNGGTFVPPTRGSRGRGYAAYTNSYEYSQSAVPNLRQTNFGQEYTIYPPDRRVPHFQYTPFLIDQSIEPSANNIYGVADVSTLHPHLTVPTSAAAYAPNTWGSPTPTTGQSFPATHFDHNTIPRGVGGSAAEGPTHGLVDGPINEVDMPDAVNSYGNANILPLTSSSTNYLPTAGVHNGEINAVAGMSISREPYYHYPQQPQQPLPTTISLNLNCIGCPKSFSSIYDLDRHLKSIHGLADTCYRCMLCQNWTHLRKDRVKRHILSKKHGCHPKDFSQRMIRSEPWSPEKQVASGQFIRVPQPLV